MDDIFCVPFRERMFDDLVCIFCVQLFESGSETFPKLINGDTRNMIILHLSLENDQGILILSEVSLFIRWINFIALITSITIILFNIFFYTFYKILEGVLEDIMGRELNMIL